ncbi:hypothetical protein QD336_05270 [Rhizobium sp. BR 250]
MSKKKELKDQRIPIMMTESEVQALDDWSFKNRIRSRGEAIRRLCHVGLTFDDHRKEVLSSHAAILNEAIKGIPAAREIAEKGSASLLERKVSHALIKTLATAMSSTLLLRMLTGIANNVKADEDFDKILTESMELTKGLKEEHELLMADFDEPIVEKEQ